MSNDSPAEFKVFAFLRRNAELLSHDDYRAAHVGFHCSITRRLKDIRGYTVNIHDEDTGLGDRLASLDSILVRNEPAGFLDLWDGFPAVHFDDRHAWVTSSEPEPTRVTEEGLVVDEDFSLGDTPYLFDRIGQSNEFRSYHTRMEEHVLLPVVRKESRPCKLIQFFRRRESLPEHDFRSRFFNEYLPLCANLPSLNGYISNVRYRDIDTAVNGYYPADHWCFSDEGRDFRESFYSLWDGANEIFVDALEDFESARSEHPDWRQIIALEDQLFDALWYVNVDENVIVMPNRQAAPSFYYR
ncbi:hypothetical protein NOR51B_807 [Luminiphilus syltensis NOR5-1B]|uniref:EthD domain-containing protein n=1 Tax=Luminiphilus syltensis NOR5-1B TaxID=565045 RepID=B8KYK4_9GAMM|nr:hypothetical protein [Luminiphilus syltensis]EED34867.1 hypothetical protein NOR51B_807 [Luminiphilus syltensis NOR5-1B]